LQAQRLDRDRPRNGRREKTGVFTGGYAVNPVNQERIPIWIADYVLMGYGTGAIMAVPGPRRARLRVRPQVRPGNHRGHSRPGARRRAGPLDRVAYTAKDAGEMINSGPFDGTPLPQAIELVTNWLAAQGIGKAAVNYKLRDWLISRQRYWGAPIPIIYCPAHGAVPVPDAELPVLLPEDVEFMPTGESPLKLHAGFLHTTCPVCGGPALRETDTMDTFMCSSWYQYRYLSPHDGAHPFDPAEGAYWLPVDQYTGGIEHATMHLIYTRFFTKAMRAMGLVDFDEPMLALYNQGMVLGEDGEKMSKSRGNVVSPDDLVAKFGADAVRTYLMFFAKWDQGGPWNYDGIKGPQRLLNDVWELAHAPYAPRPRRRRPRARCAAKPTRRFARWARTWRASALTRPSPPSWSCATPCKRLLRETAVTLAAWNEALDNLLLVLAPIAPHITEELWPARPFLQHPPARLAPVGRRGRPRGDGHAGGAGQRQGARPHRGRRRPGGRGAQAVGAGFRQRAALSGRPPAAPGYRRQGAAGEHRLLAACRPKPASDPRIFCVTMQVVIFSGSILIGGPNACSSEPRGNS
jgi:leucyl-tRNA synthetase